jgi:hypothetical protein
MRKLFAAALLLSAASVTTIAVAGQIKPDKPGVESGVIVSSQQETAQADPIISAPVAPTPDARTMASDQEVGEARRAYRAACDAHESTAFCECVTAGVAQALMPSEVRIAARTIGERITAQGDASIASDSDNTMGAQSSAARIEQVESHYADACVQYRG